MSTNADKFWEYMRVLSMGVLVALFGFSTVDRVLAQAPPDWLEQGQQAYEEKRYEDAATAYRLILEKEPKNAEARFLLARALLEHGDVKDAQRTIDRALRLDPENVAYLELQLAIGFPRELLEVLRRTKRDELSVKILLLDSLSVVANIQLGKSYLNEWLEWRERFTAEDLVQIQNGWLGDTRPEEENLLARFVDNTNVSEIADEGVPPSDPFDLYQLQLLSSNIQVLSPRAEHAYPLAERYLKRSLLREPANLEAYLNLARLYLTRHDMLALLGIARSMREHLPENYYTWLLGGYGQHYRENETEAGKQLTSALGLMPDTIRAVYEDTDRLMNTAGQNRDGQRPGLSTASFWEVRDPRLLTSENERLNDHYARILYADLLFAEPRLDMAGWDSERGEVYIRYGKPQLEFYLSNKVADCGLSTLDMFHVFQYPASRFVFANRSPNLNDYAFYSPCSQVVSSRGGVGANTDYVLKAEETIRENPDDYTYDAGGKQVEFPYLVSNFKGANGLVDVYVPYGIPVKFNATQLSQKLALNTGAFLLSDDVGLLDEHRAATSEINMSEVTRFGGAALWLDTHHLEAKPGSYDLSVEFETGSGAGTGFHRTKIDIPDFRGGNLVLSDLLLAYAVEEAGPAETQAAEGMLLRDGLMIQPAPWGVFNRMQPTYLYFEMYNLRKNAESRTRYEVETVLIENRDEKGLEKVLKRAFRGRAKEGVSVRFENTGTSSDEGQYLILETQDQPAGTYLLVMRVHDLIGETVVETRRMVLLE